MYDAITRGMQRQLLLIEQALNRKLQADEDVYEIRSGLFYVNPEEIVFIDDGIAEKVSFFLLEPEIQHDIFLYYAKE